MLRLIPNLLTLARIAAIPLVVLCFYLNASWSSVCAAIIFALACITDFLDGYLARQLKHVSEFGKFFDPIADKLLVSSTILMLAGFGYITDLSLIPATIILCREILVSGMREFLAQTKIPIPVTNLAKWKTAIQMIALFLLLVFTTDVKLLWWIGTLGIISLWFSAILTVITGYEYLLFGFSKKKFNPVKK